MVGLGAVGSAHGAPVLKGIVQHEHVGTPPPRLMRAPHTVWIGDDGHGRIEQRMHARLIVTHATQQHGRMRAARGEFGDDPRRHGRLPRPTDRQIPDAHRWNGERMRTQDASIVQAPARGRGGAEQRGQRRQRPAREHRAGVRAVPDPLHPPVA